VGRAAARQVESGHGLNAGSCTTHRKARVDQTALQLAEIMDL